MLQRFLDYADEHHLFPDGQTVLLAVSGGRDSVCLAHLCHRARISFAIAHCNFHLRPGDCDRDQQFVARLADTLQVPFYTTDFDTRAVAAANHQSIEEAARILRYNYFAELLTTELKTKTENLNLVATAHHRDDSIETFFLNLLRGTGISGLHGIQPVSTQTIKQSGNQTITVVRPLLCFSRAEIDAYIEENHLEYVEDSTNYELEARRNQIRHRLIPLMRELYPAFDNTMQANIERLHDTEIIYKQYIEELRTRLISPYQSILPYLPVDIIAIDLSELKARTEKLSPFTSHLSPLTLLFELLRPYGFNASQIGDILRTLKQSSNQAIKQSSGRLFYSPSHVAELHRGQLLLAPLPTQQPTDQDAFVLSPYLLNSLSPEMETELKTKTENLNSIRHWRPSDRFRPKGFHHSRLVSDFLKDLHLSRIEKQYVLVRVDKDDRILSVIGLRDAE